MLVLEPSALGLFHTGVSIKIQTRFPNCSLWQTDLGKAVLGILLCNQQYNVSTKSRVSTENSLCGKGTWHQWTYIGSAGPLHEHVSFICSINLFF